jgi:hypothetical protein
VPGVQDTGFGGKTVREAGMTGSSTASLRGTPLLSGTALTSRRGGKQQPCVHLGHVQRMNQTRTAHGRRVESHTAELCRRIVCQPWISPETFPQDPERPRKPRG